MLSLRKLASPQKKAILYKDLSELPIVNFFRIIETADLSLLSKNGKPIEPIEAQKHWERLMFEFETLTGTNDYRMQLREASEDTKTINRLNALISIYYLSTLGGLDVSEDMKYWNVTGNDFNAIKVEILREKTRLNIETIERSKNKNEKQDFYDLWTAVENGLNRNIDVEVCSVKKWYSLCHALEKKANYYNSLKNKNGRQD